MTMPNERARALRWAHEFLQEVRDDASVDPSARARAAELLCHFPLPVTVPDWIRMDVQCIPPEAAQAIDGTGELLSQILRSPACSRDLRRNALFTSRHFPVPGEAHRWTVGVRCFSIHQWLLPEDHYR